MQDGKGGKGDNLIKLKQAGFRVPEFEVIDFETLKNQRHDALAARIERITAKNTQQKYAVRSSANVEDSQDRSFAGIFHSYLDLTKGEVLEKVYQVLKSAQCGVGHYTNYSDEIEMSVIIQRYIDADYSGICFTDCAGNMIFNLCTGCGEQLASGEQKGQEMRVRRDTYNITVCDELFNHIQSDELVRTCLKVERLFGRGQDIEFCIQSDVQYLLQSRPITI
jgi:pyruvate,water dikinase